MKDEIWWCLQKDWQQPASARKIPKIPLGLLKKASITNPNTGREVGIYYISKTNFNKIKNFWIQNYFITDIYNVTKEIQKITKDIKTNISSYFDELLNDYYHHFVIYKDKETSSKTSHLVYWLNFIVQIFKELKIPDNSDYYNIGFEFKTWKKNWIELIELTCIKT